ncbi:MAG TPA: MarR family transcriptional regulator [Bacillota bacterium]|nr:MarR family transcriptional regulator [Bacillota bacterium]
MDNQQLHTFPNHQDLVDLQKRIPQLDVPSMEIIFILLKTVGELSNAFHTYLSDYGLSQGKMKILLQLYKDSGKGLLPSELAICSGVTRGTITGLIDGLEKDGYVERIHHKNDRRMVMVKITSLGAELTEKVLPKHFLDVKKLIDHISVPEQESLMNILRKLLAEIPTMHS